MVRTTTAVATTVLAVLAVVAALYLMREVLVPIALALVLAALLNPVVGWLRRLRFPAPLAATVTLLVLLEVTPLFAIRDNLTLNVWALIAPNAAVQAWQSGG